jgi:predicted 2-oxoglutarate/Fe(II)-dependent dioxygenase YbiX
MANTLDSHILNIKNVLSEELCSSILEEYENSEVWVQATVGSDATVDKSVRSLRTASISEKSVVEKNPVVRSSIDSSLFEAAGKAMKEYSSVFPHCRLSEDCGYSLLRYGIGEYYKEHVDASSSIPRTLSCSFGISDEYEGGEFSFFDRSLTLRLNKGDALLFPSNFMYPHQILPVTKGVRHSVVTWFI